MLEKTAKVMTLGRIGAVAAMLAILTILLTGSRNSALADESVQTDSLQSVTETVPVSGAYTAHSAAASDALSEYMAGQSIFPSFLKITLALVAVIAGIYLTLALLKKAMGRKVSSGGRANAIEVIETCYLAPKRSISLVRIGSRGALLSVSDNSIATLLELSPEETGEIVKTVGSRAGAPDFRQTLQKAKQRIVGIGSFAIKQRERSHVGSAGVKV